MHWARLEASALGCLIAACPVWKRREERQCTDIWSSVCYLFTWSLASAFSLCFAYSMMCTHIQCVPKKYAPWCLFVITLVNVDWFSKFFPQVIRKKIPYVYTTKISTSPAICCYITLRNVKIQKRYWVWQHPQRTVDMFLWHFEDLITFWSLSDTVLNQQFSFTLLHHGDFFTMIIFAASSFFLHYTSYIVHIFK